MMTKELLLKLFRVSDPESEGAQSILSEYDRVISKIMLVAISEWMDKNEGADTDAIKQIILSLKDDAETDFDSLIPKLKGYGELIQSFYKKVDDFHDTLYTAQVMQMQDFELDELQSFLEEMKGEVDYNKEELEAKIKAKLSGDGEVSQPSDQSATSEFDFSVIPDEETTQNTDELKPTQEQPTETSQATASAEISEPQKNVEPEKIEKANEAELVIQPQVTPNENAQAVPEQATETDQNELTPEAQPNIPPPMNLGGSLNQRSDQNNISQLY